MEIVRRLFADFQAGVERDDLGARSEYPEVVADDVEWDVSGYPTVDLPSRGSGRDKLLDLFGTYLSGWTSYQAEVTEFIERANSMGFDDFFVGRRRGGRRRCHSRKGPRRR